jgi:multidrug efflux system outer membrane protein
MSRVVPVAVTAMLLGACATQPDYRSPARSLQAEWTNGTDRASTANVADAEHEVWWTALRDPAIDALVSAALADNPTLAEAAARVDQAMAIYAVERAQRSPRATRTFSRAAPMSMPHFQLSQ